MTDPGDVLSPSVGACVHPQRLSPGPHNGAVLPLVMISLICPSLPATSSRACRTRLHVRRYQGCCRLSASHRSGQAVSIHQTVAPPRRSGRIGWPKGEGCRALLLGWTSLWRYQKWFWHLLRHPWTSRSRLDPCCQHVYVCIVLCVCVIIVWCSIINPDGKYS